MKFRRILKLFLRIIRQRKKITMKRNHFQVKEMSIHLSSHFIVVFSHFPTANPKTVLIQNVLQHLFILLNLCLALKEYIHLVSSKMIIQMKGKKAVTVKRDNILKMIKTQTSNNSKNNLYRKHSRTTGQYSLAYTAANKKASRILVRQRKSERRQNRLPLSWIKTSV